MVTMRLSRIGSKKRPYYRIVVIDKRTKRVVWSYGHLNEPGRAPGFMNKPDGLDLLPAVAGPLGPELLEFLPRLRPKVQERFKLPRRTGFDAAPNAKERGHRCPGRGPRRPALLPLLRPRLRVTS